MGPTSGFSNGSRNIPRFLQTGDGECLVTKIRGVVYRERRRRSGGFAIAIGAARDEGNPPSRKTGRRLKQLLRERLQAREAMFWMWYGKAKVESGAMADFFLENYSEPPMRQRRPTR